MTLDQTWLDDFPPYDDGVVISDLSFFVVGIGASAGGIDALLRLFREMPADSGMAFVVVMHLSPEHESNIAHILQKVTTMPVLMVDQKLPVEVNRIYVIKPGHQLLLNDNYLQVTPSPRPRGRHIAIDLFFRSLAETHRSRAIGIVLSGTDSDGAVGMTRIKEKGGVSMVQAPADAEFEGMPRNAIETGMADFVLPVADMAAKLIDICRNAQRIELPPPQPIVNVETDAKLRESEQALREVMNSLRQRTGHDFKHYKRATVLRRIERRLQVNLLPDILSYRDYFAQHDEETPLLLKDMLIGVTNFFRDPQAFEVLEQQIIPQLFDAAPVAEPVRAWSVGCASGEEAYSIAMLFAEHAQRGAKRTFNVFASDIDESALRSGRQAIYPASIATDVTPERLQRFFAFEHTHYRVRDEICERVLFAAHNILRDPPFSKLNLICCRNLLIYLDRSVHSRIFEMFHFALRPGGYLFLGSSESAESASEFFVQVDKKHRIYRASTLSRISRYALPMTFSVGQRDNLLKPATELLEKRRLPLHELHQRVLQKHTPPSVLVDQESTILFLSKSASRFLHYQGGVPSHNLLQVAHPDLQLELRSMLFQANHSDQKSTSRPLTMRDVDSVIQVRIEVRPVREEELGAPMNLVLFFDVSDSSDDAPLIDPTVQNMAAQQMEIELKRTQAQLQLVIEQYEGSSEELRASNEELQAINEELRSATEELETSREELQSINEEMTTVNSELKAKVDETSKANDDLQNFAAATDIAAVFVDRTMRIKRFTQPALKIFNMIASDIGRPLLDLTHRLDYDTLPQDVAQVFDQLLVIEREVPAEGGKWFIARLLPYRTAEDRIEGLVLTFIDISGRKKAEDDLRRGEERMRLLVASTQDHAIFTLDLNGLITSWNLGAQNIFGFTEQEVIGQFGELIYSNEDRERGVFDAEMRVARSEGRALDERWHVRKNGTRVFCSGSMSLLRDDTVHGYAKIARDATGTKYAEVAQKALLEHEKEVRVRAEDATRLRDEFFAVLSHELKQPLNLIQLTAEVLSRLPETGKIPALARAALTIKRSVAGQARIIDDLLDLSRVHTGKLTLDRSRVEWREIVKRSVEMLLEDARTSEIEIRLDCGDTPLPIDGDLVRIEQIVWNLISNAWKFTPAGGVIDISLTRDDQFAVLRVADTGKGIGPEFLPYVFEMFRQADTGTTRRYGGMGIGLALVKELVQSHGGEVSVKSAGVNKGSEFTVRLPLGLDTTPLLPMSIIKPLEVSCILYGKRVLLVDDATDTLESLAQLLQSQHAEVSASASSAAALRAAQQSSATYDLIISDIGMPLMDGYALLHQLRKQSATNTTPAIALTGFNRECDAEQSRQAGFVAHIGKPVVFDELLKLIATVLNLGKR